jgi:hypothetical protein
MQQLDPRRSSQSSFGSARAREASQITTEADRLDGWTLPAGEHSALPWWRWGVTYQIYPLSFQDTNGDGKGDLPGVLLRLEHLSWLGVSAVWLSPVYCSPMEDFGYDIADFTDVDQLFGTLDDLDSLPASSPLPWRERSRTCLVRDCATEKARSCLPHLNAKTHLFADNT